MSLRHRPSRIRGGRATRAISRSEADRRNACPPPTAACAWDDRAPGRAPCGRPRRPCRLTAHELRPSLVATRRREVTQLKRSSSSRHRRLLRLRWWSTYEAFGQLHDLRPGGLCSRLADVRRLLIDDRMCLNRRPARYHLVPLQACPPASGPLSHGARDHARPCQGSSIACGRSRPLAWS